jgi:MFS family permease
MRGVAAIFGWCADKTTSRRLPLLLGLLALGGSTAFLCAGSSIPVLVMGRALQGLSASVVWTVGLALLSETVSKEDMGQAMGYIAAATSVGQLAGPLLGGVVYAHAGYYVVFAMGFVIIGLDIFLRLMLIERHVAEQWSLSSEVSPSEEPGATGTEDPSREDIQPLPTQIEQSATTVSSESEKGTSGKDTPQWMKALPPVITLLRIPRLLAALFGCFIQAIALASFDSVLPLYVKETFHWTSTGAGLIFICLVIPALASPLVGYFSDRYGSRLFTTVGLLGCVPFWVLLRLVMYDSIGQKILLCALLVLIGICLTLIMPPLLAEIDHVVGLEEKKRPGSLGKRGAAAQAFGLFNVAFALGTLIGPLWAGFVVKKAGWGTMGWTLAILSGVGAMVTFIWTGGRIVLKGKERSSGDVV